jgi:hypothetical protein
MSFWLFFNRMIEWLLLFDLELWRHHFLLLDLQGLYLYLVLGLSLWRLGLFRGVVSLPFVANKEVRSIEEAWVSLLAIEALSSLRTRVDMV